MKKFFEVIIITALLIFLTRFLYVSQNTPFVGKYYATIFAVLFLYVPVVVFWIKKQKIDFLDRSLGGFLRGLVYFLVTSVVIFLPYLVCAHLWMIYIEGKPAFVAAPFPDIWQTIIFQMLFVALPEEFYFRGYMQGTLNGVFKRSCRFLGVNVGWSILITSVVFAFSHSFVHCAWWHFSIFFPSLLFGWLREKTGSITAPVLFHAACNVISSWLITFYH